MGKAARAIIIENNKLLVMYRQKGTAKYFTLVGGQVGPGETTENALIREINEETGLTITGGQLMYIEEHHQPYNDQYIYLCTVAPHDEIAIQEGSEEGVMNRFEYNTHTPMWVDFNAFKTLPFRTSELQKAIVKAVAKGFPGTPVKLSTTGAPQ